MQPPKDAKTADRILFHLKTKGPRSASWLAEKLGVTSMAVRQHLQRLLDDGLVDYEEERRGVGRPKRLWRPTPAADARFPSGTGDLTVELLESARAAFGDEGIERLIEVRTERQLATYASAVPSSDAPLSRRVAALARLRDREGYLAEWSRTNDGAFLLVENHCPICIAATACQGLCAGELRLFRRTLGDDVEVERTEHLLDGARRCAYRIAPRADA